MLSILHILAVALDALNLLNLLYFAFSAWRYLLSPKYRTRVQARWQQCSQSLIATEIIGSVLAAAISLFLAGLLVCAILGIGWFAPAQP
jgi:hypothetical protein